ncbi:hypothetical protein QP238_15005, partial [Enterococcus faecalis]|uniref:hypothetical protein n=1 Tax=Enterococcus faecalis TaxID=1351 RepID=UPI00254B45C4
VQGLEVLGLTPHQHDVATHTISSVCSIMHDAAREADAAGLPPAHSAQVVAVDKPNRNTAVVRLESGMALDYRAGQH